VASALQLDIDSPTPDKVVLDDPLFTPQEIAKALKMSDDYVRRLFEREPGVIFLPSPGRASARRHRTMRIPKSVLVRVCQAGAR